MGAKVSVIIPVFNTDKYLAECLDSVISQTLSDIEIIVVNDKSTDNSKEIIERYLQKDSHIVFVDKPNNEGVGAARNDGINKATGKYVCFLDSDDLYPSQDVLRHLFDYATNNHLLVVGGRREELIDGEITLRENPIAEYSMEFFQEGIMDYSEYQYDCGYTCYLFDRELLTINKIEFPRYARFQDPPFFVRAMTAAGKYGFLDEPVYRYRIIPSASKYTMKKTLDMLQGIMDNLAFSRENGLAKLHYLSALRLDHEGSFMAEKNLFGDEPERESLLYKMIQANSRVDAKWLKENGFQIQDPFVMEAFQYTLELAKKYDSVRNKKIVKAFKRLIGK